MTTAVLEPRTYPFDVEDIEYLRHGDKPLLARVFRPRGEGPFPALVECHGGAWCLSDRTTERLRHEAMAKNGIVSIALDFPLGQRGPVSVLRAGHQLRGALGEAQCACTEDPRRTGGPLRPVERRTSCHARRHAAAGCALRGDPSAGRFQRAGCDSGLRPDVMAGDQSVEPV